MTSVEKKRFCFSEEEKRERERERERDQRENAKRDSTLSWK
jgi:hypothetical protein